MSMCQHGDCIAEIRAGRAAVRVTITWNASGERMESKGFCCPEHAAEWLNDHARAFAGRYTAAANLSAKPE